MGAYAEALTGDVPEPLVFLRAKSHKGVRHASDCVLVGGAFVYDDYGRPPSPMRSKASNRCEGCARATAFVNMTMLRQDAEAGEPPRYVLTLTSSRIRWTGEEYSRACATFWQAWRRRWGKVEYCGFVEFTTGQASTSGGHRRMHTHWVIKARDGLDVRAVQEWVSAEWVKLTGAWRVELARLESVGGVVGYLALHHEKFEQRPPAGWKGRRLRPSKGYFTEPGHRRLAIAKLWLQERQWGRIDEYGLERVMPPSGGRVVFRGKSWTEIEGRASSTVLATPGPSFDSLPMRREFERKLREWDRGARDADREAYLAGG
jgi:hypothetical protein